IGGDWREAQSGKRFPTINPATGDTLLEVAEGDAPDIDLAVQAARRAFEGPWGKMSASERGRALWKLGDLIGAKAAELAQLTALRLGELALEAGLPPGVLNVVPGFGPTAGAALVAHGDVNGVAFTGETTTGKLIMQNAARSLKKVSLELGGKSPNIIFADAD